MTNVDLAAQMESLSALIQQATREEAFQNRFQTNVRISNEEQTNQQIVLQNHRNDAEREREREKGV